MSNGKIQATGQQKIAENEINMKKLIATLSTVLATLSYGHFSAAQELGSIPLTDVIKSQGTGNIDLLKDVSVSQLEQLRADNDGQLIGKKLIFSK